MGAFPAGFPRGYRGAERHNELSLDCDKHNALVNITILPTLSSGPVRKVHYIVPFTDNSYGLPSPYIPPLLLIRRCLDGGWMAGWMWARSRRAMR